MTKFTPNFGWPVAEDADVVKQYPSAVDDPFKSALDAQVSRGVYLSGTYGAAPPNTSTPIPMDQINVSWGDNSWYALEGTTLVLKSPGVFRYITRTGFSKSGDTINIPATGIFYITTTNDVTVEPAGSVIISESTYYRLSATLLVNGATNAFSVQEWTPDINWSVISMTCNLIVEYLCPVYSTS